jgi:putative dimethyl sulfoxide reductase chaperone
MVNGKQANEHNMLKGYNMLLYFAGTMIMFDPSKECIQDFWSEGILKSLPVSSSNPRFMKAASQLRESIASNNIFEKMKQDYNSLFSGSQKPLAPPFESQYRNHKEYLPGSQQEVNEFYKSYGWESKFKDSIPEDHLGIELLFLTLMVEKYLELDDEACSYEMRNEICRFLDQHILSWVPEWNKNIQTGAITLGYKGIGTLIEACAEDLHGIMESKNRPAN